jgi:GAF domain-containing protein
VNSTVLLQSALLAPLVAGLAYCAFRARSASGLRVLAAAALLLSLGLLQLLTLSEAPDDLASLLLGGQLPGLAARLTAHLLAAFTAASLVRSVWERDRAEEVQWESMEAVRELGAFFSLERGRFDVRLGQLLALGCRKLDLEHGIVGRIEGDRYEIVDIHAPPELALARGDCIELGRTLCRDTIRTTTVLAVESLAQHARRDSRPEPIGVQSYLGIALRVEGEVFGTLSFGSTRTRGRRFAGVEKQLLELMAHWVETELSRVRHEQSKRLLAPRSDDADRRRVDVNEALEQLDAAMRESLGENGLLLELGRLDRAARIYRHEFDRVLWSLLQHAAANSADGSTLRVSTSAVAPPDEAPTPTTTFLSLAIHASGSGADPGAGSELSKLPVDPEQPQTPGSEARPAREALLSLSRVRRLLEDSGGDLSIHSEPGLGTAFTAWLPAAPEVEPASAPDEFGGLRVE